MLDFGKIVLSMKDERNADREKAYNGKQGNQQVNVAFRHIPSKAGGIGMCAYVGFYDDKRPMYQIAKPVCLYTVYKQRDDQENPCE